MPSCLRLLSNSIITSRAEKKESETEKPFQPTEPDTPPFLLDNHRLNRFHFIRVALFKVGIIMKSFSGSRRVVVVVVVIAAVCCCGPRKDQSSNRHRKASRRSSTGSYGSNKSE